MSFFIVDDFGLTITLTVVDASCDFVDVSAFTIQFEIEDPRRNVNTVAASFVTDGTDGRVTYTLATGDLDETGVWFVRARMIQGITSVFRTEKVKFTVEK